MSSRSAPNTSETASPTFDGEVPAVMWSKKFGLPRERSADKYSDPLSIGRDSGCAASRILCSSHGAELNETVGLGIRVAQLVWRQWILSIRRSSDVTCR